MRIQNLRKVTREVYISKEFQEEIEGNRYQITKREYVLSDVRNAILALGRRGGCLKSNGYLERKLGAEASV